VRYGLVPVDWPLRHLLVCVLLASSTAVSAPPTGVTLIFEFAKRSTDVTVGELKKELAGLFRDSGFDLDFKLAQELGANPQFGRVVSIRFEGDCRMAKTSWRLRRRGTLGFSHEVDGEVLPFIEIQCDLIRDLVQSATAAEGPRSDLLLGRALGRVVAHELYHVLIKTRKHGHGLARPTLTADELVQDQLVFDSADFAQFTNSP